MVAHQVLPTRWGLGLGPGLKAEPPGPLTHKPGLIEPSGLPGSSPLPGSKLLVPSLRELIIYEKSFLVGHSQKLLLHSSPPPALNRCTSPCLTTSENVEAPVKPSLVCALCNFPLSITVSPSSCPLRHPNFKPVSQTLSAPGSWSPCMSSRYEELMSIEQKFQH